MILYSYNSDGFYTGSFKAQPNPMFGVLEGEEEFLIAANSTARKPLNASSGEINKFVNGDWIVIRDPAVLALLDLVSAYGTPLYETVDGEIVPRDPNVIHSEDAFSIAAQEAAAAAAAAQAEQDLQDKMAIYNSGVAKIQTLLQSVGSQLTNEEMNLLFPLN